MSRVDSEQRVAIHAHARTEVVEAEEARLGARVVVAASEEPRQEGDNLRVGREVRPWQETEPFGRCDRTWL